MPVDQAVSHFVKLGVAYWRSLCGQRRFPARADMTLRGAAAILPYSVIVKVIDGGDDFEYRFVGEAQRQAFKASFKGLRVSQIEAAVPQLGSVLRAAYERVVVPGTPFIIRGRVDHALTDAQMLFHETAFLPLGASDAAVDHLLIVGVQVPEPFWSVSADRLAVLADQIRSATTGEAPAAAATAASDGAAPISRSN